MKFYLAGPFLPYKKYADWRDFVIEKVKKHSFLDPRNNRQDSPMYFTMDDLEGVTRSEGLLLYRSPLAEAIGGACEHGVAFGYSLASSKKVPTIYVDEAMFIFPLLAASAKRTFTNLEAATVYLNLLDSWKTEFKAIIGYLGWEEQYYKDLKENKNGS